MSDADDAARAALQDAVHGEHTPNLQINYAIVSGASGVVSDKADASRELARLATDGPDIEQRVVALERAIALWHEIPAKAEDGDKPPSELITAARILTVAATNEDAHDDVMAFLSWADSDWLANSKNTDSSPHCLTARHRYRVARGASPSDGWPTCSAARPGRSTGC